MVQNDYQGVLEAPGAKIDSHRLKTRVIANDSGASGKCTFELIEILLSSSSVATVTESGCIMKNSKSRKSKLSTMICAALASAGAGVISPSLLAQSNNIALEQIVATAQRREENLQVVPIAITTAQEAAIEEIVVIGSYIRRDNLDSAVPLTVINADDISSSGALQLGEFIADATYNYGSDDVRNGLSGADGISTGFNLRGLGDSATLNLLDGRRRIGNDVNSIYPTLAIQRIEILRDGGSALYGTDAVSGVVNIIPVKSFEGIKVQVGYDADQEGSSNQKTLEVITGFSTDKINFVFAVEYKDRGRIEWTDRPEYLRAGFSDSGFGNPGNFRVPVRDEFGALTGASATRPDPACESDGSSSDEGAETNNTSGFIGPFGDCRLAYGSTWDSQSAREYLGTYANFSMDISDNVEFEFQGLYSKTKSSIRVTGASSGGNVSLLPVIVGENPFNPFRAVDASGNELFAQDLDTNGIPDRDTGGVVILDPTGIAFNEDVVFANWRPFGKWGTLPHGVNPDGASEGPRQGPERVSLTGILKFDVPDSSWSGWTSYSFQQDVTSAGVYSDSTSRLIDALLGNGGFSGDEYFNPFFAAQPTNSQSIVDFIRQRPAATETTDTLRLLDFVATGDLFEIPAGTIRAAFGGQYRQERSKSDPAEINRLGDAWAGTPAAPTRFDRDTKAVFGELAVPLLTDLEMQLAIRYEDSGSGLDTTDPKIGLLYKPLDSLSLRASWGTSFIAPSSSQLAGPVSCGLTSVEDKILGASQSFVNVCSGGNPNLDPESADVWNIGFTWIITDDLTLIADYLDIDFEDRLVFTSAQDIVNLDKSNMDAAGSTGSAWIASGNSDSRVVRNVIDDSIVRVDSGTSNASEMSFSSIDVSLIYNFEIGEIGDFGIQLDASYIDDYTYQLLPISPKVQGAGKQNNGTGAVPPLPRLKSNLGLSWFKGNQAASLQVHYAHGVRYDSIVRGLAGFYGRSQYAPEKIDAWVQVNAQYRIAFEGLIPGQSDEETILTLGVVNLFDEMAQPLFHLGGYEGLLHNPFGRQFYVRLSLQF